VRTSASSRTAATLTALLTLGMLWSPPADAAPTPGVTDLQGRVVDTSGHPLAGVLVTIYDAATGGYVANMDSGADGVWHFDNLDADSAASYKVSFMHDSLPYGQICFQTVYFGQQPTLARGATIPEPPANSSTNVGDTRLTRFAAVAGSVTAPGFNLTDNPFGDHVQVIAYDVDDREVGYALADTDPANAVPDGSYFLGLGLVPGHTYKFRFVGRDYDPVTGKGTIFVSEFYKSGSTFAQATPVTVGPEGSATTLDAVTLTNTLKASQLPMITGEPRVGRTLTASSGQWNANAKAEYSYRWLRGTVVVGTAAAYTPTKSDLARPLQVEVTSRIDDFIGTAASEPSDRVKYASKVRVKGKQARIRGRKAAVLTLTVKASGLKASKVSGQAFVTERGKKVATGTVEDGRLVLAILGAGTGKHTYVVTYRGTRIIAGDKVTRKVSVS
jgi:hypothetical protein